MKKTHVLYIISAMRNYLYIKTIAEKRSLISKDKLNALSDITGKDIISTAQCFIGHGFAELAMSDDKDYIEKVHSGLQSAGAGVFKISRDEMEQLFSRTLRADAVAETENSFIVQYGNNEIKLNKKQPINIIIGSDCEKVDSDKLQAIMLNSKYSVLIYFRNDNVIIRIDSDRTNLSGIMNADRFSKSENMKTLLKHAEAKAAQSNRDMFYSLNYIPGRPDIAHYAVISSILFNRGFYEFSYDEGYYNEQAGREDMHFDYDYKYRIYKPHEQVLERAIFSRFKLGGFIGAPLIVLGILLFMAGPHTGLHVFRYALIGAFVYYTVIFANYFRFKSFIEDIPSSSIKSLSIGLREIKGSVLEMNAIPSLISGMKCVFFRYYKYAKVKTDKGEQWKIKEIGEYLPERFYIQQDGYVLEIETKGAIMDLNNMQKYTIPFYLLKSGIRDSRVYYVEESIPVFSDIYVMGSVIDKDNRAAYTRFLKNKKSDSEYMRQFDRDRNNEIDMNEWEEAKKAIDTEFRRIEDEKLQNELLRVCRTKDDNMLFISDRSEKSIIKSMNIYLSLAAFLGIVSIVWAAFLIWR